MHTRAESVTITCLSPESKVGCMGCMRLSRELAINTAGDVVQLVAMFSQSAADTASRHHDRVRVECSSTSTS